MNLHIRTFSFATSIDTGINVNVGGVGGGTILALVSGHASYSITYSTVAYIQLSHSSGEANITDLGSKLSWLLEVNVSDNGTLVLTKKMDT